MGTEIQHKQSCLHAQAVLRVLMNEIEAQLANVPTEESPAFVAALDEAITRAGMLIFEGDEAKQRAWLESELEG